MAKNPKRLFNKDYAHELLSIAGGDAISARSLFTTENPGRLENVVYLVQQAVEKCIKAVLVHRQVAFPLVHDLGTLVALLPDEEGPLPLSHDEVTISLNTSEDILNWATKIIKVTR